jgi:hypothetical protein
MIQLDIKGGHCFAWFMGRRAIVKASVRSRTWCPPHAPAPQRNGVTVEPGDTAAIAAAITAIVTQPDTWDIYSSNGR